MVFMKNIALSATVLLASNMSMATGSLWNVNVDAYQVQVPETVDCDKTGDDYGAACYQSTGGWWFAYVGDEKHGQTMSFDPIEKIDDGIYKLILYDEWYDGNLIEGVGLWVTMSAAGGDSSTPAIAGIGFNWTKAETPIDISTHDGYCIEYSWTGSQALQMELGWDEKANGNDSWYAELPATPDSNSILDLPWEKFMQDGWDEAKKAIDIALTQAVSLKIRLKNSTAAEVKGSLTIVELGWVGECGTNGKDAVGSFAKASSVKATLSGRTLSFSGINSAATAEVMNLQGQVVLQGSTASAMNLAGLEAGVYMVRVAGSANLTQKILVK